MDLALGTVRGAIARAVLPPLVPETLGGVRLFRHQREAAALLRARLRRYRGAVLADPVGTGKTYTALACAAEYDQVSVVAPASLRATWSRALAEVHRVAAFTSMESLSRVRSGDAGTAGGLVIVDEAHHFRSPGTRRYAALADLAWGRHLLLLTATPVHNAARDLDALFALFADPRTARCAGAAEFVIHRHAPATDGALPRLAPPRWLENPADPRMLQRLLALPSPVPLQDGGVAQALGVLGLVRLWASSHAALMAALRRRRAAAAAMRVLVESGETPTAQAVRQCLGSDGMVQLPLALLSGAGGASRTWLLALDRWTDALDALQGALVTAGSTDDVRFAQVMDCLARHRGTAAVLFTHSIDTARALYRFVSPRLACAGLWGGATRVASGRATREEVLRLLRPGVPADPRMPLQALIATDVVAEGIDLHAAGVLVHLDLPWTSARLAQRAGRLRRHGSPHACVVQYAFPMPPCGEAQVRILQRLCRKAQVSRATLGIDPFALAFPGAHPNPAPGIVPRGIDRLRSIVRSWNCGMEPDRGATAIVAARVSGLRHAFVAVVDSGGDLVVAARHEGAVTTDHHVIASLLERAAGAEVVQPEDEAAALALRRLQQWMQERGARDALHLAPGEIQHRTLRAIASLVSGAGRLRRGQLLAAADEARRLVMGSGAAGGLRRMATWLNGEHHDPAASLQRLVRDLRPGAQCAPVETRWSVRALLLLT